MSLKLFIMTLLVSSVNAWAADSHAPKVAPALPLGFSTSQSYVHGWVEFPDLSVRDLDTGEPTDLKTRKGRSLVVVFIASWCLPCQQIMKPIKALEARYKDRYTDFVYVFAHDTEADAKGFSNFHKLAPRAYLGSAKLLERFHQPELPSYYVSDRYGWLLDRKLSIKDKDLAALDRILDLHNAF